MRVEILNGAFYVSIADAVRMAYGMESRERVWGKPLHSKARELPGLIKHERAWFAPAFDLAELITEAEIGSFEHTAEQIILGAEVARNRRREQMAREREEARKKEQQAEEIERKAKKRETTLDAIEKARKELKEAVINDEKIDEYQEIELRGMEGWDA